jgi:3',5'-cyclic AMP phosphodiesterase CpdA
VRAPRLTARLNWLRVAPDREIIRRRTAPDSGSDYELLLPPPADPASFHVLALGDTGDSEGFAPGASPQDGVATFLAADAALPGSAGTGQLLLHTGDVVYMTGEARLYEANFRRPYAAFLTPESTARALTFTLPFLAVPGNHDYYDFAGWARWLTRTPLVGPGVKALAREFFAYQVPRGGSDMGGAWADAFVTPGATDYLPGHSTRLPNRYYWFRYGWADFFALDSNTLEPPPPGTDPARVRRDALRHIETLHLRALSLAARLEEAEAGLGAEPPGEAQAENLRRLSEQALDTQRELARERNRLHYEPADHDAAQLAWLERVLARSVRERPDAWRVVYLHHPLYTSLTNYCENGDVTGVRDNLLDRLRGRVDLILSGHAHAFEYLRSEHLPDTALVVTGGGGQVSLRRSVVAPEARGRYAMRYAALRRAGVTECVVSGRGPTAPDGEAGALYHYLRLEVAADRLRVSPIGVRRLLGGGYRREEPLPAFHAAELPASDPPWQARRLEAVEVRRGAPPRLAWAPPLRPERP